MTLTVLAVEVAPHVRGVFTGRDSDDATPAPGVGLAGNLSTSQPHLPARLAGDRAAAAAAVGLASDDVVWMRQVHGNRVAVVDPALPPAAVVDDVDGLVTAQAGRGLAVLVADCVPVLLAGEDTVGVAHAGRRGVAAGVVDAVVATMRDLGDGGLRAVIGPAIRGCCYEVPDWLHDEFTTTSPAAHATTTWGTPALDLPAAVASDLESLGVRVDDLRTCTRCDRRWFSHRSSNRAAGRQVGLVTRSPDPASDPSPDPTPDLTSEQ